MQCEMTESVSRLFDGELAADEIREVKQHLFTCAICRQAQEDFLKLRNQLQSDEAGADAVAQQKVLREILAANSTPFWQRKVSLSAPTFAMLVLLVMALSVLTLFIGRSQKSLPAAAPVKPVGGGISKQGIDFSHYDTGERAVIYKKKR